jgi:CheY-like chemotaxis protein
VARRIGELLVERGVATRAQIEAALRDRHHASLPLASRLHAAGVDEGALAAVLAERYGMPGVDLSRTTIALEALDVAPRAVAEGDLILPLSLEGGRIHLAMAHPLDARVVSELRFVTGLEVSPYVALRGPLDAAIAAAYDARARGEATWEGAAAFEAGAPQVGAALPEADDGPILDAQLLPDEDDAGVVAVEVGEPEPAVRPRDGRPLVLVVDDEPEILQLVGRMLAAKGYAVETAADGAEALARADALVPDVVLLDAMLPKVHGFEACRRLKASARTRHVPVVMMTAIYRGWRFAQDARDNYGAEDYVEKPFRLDDLLRRLDAARVAGAARAGAGADAPVAGEPELGEARALLAAGDAAGAAAHLGALAHESPFSAEVHFLLGRALRATGDGFGAMTALERAVELRPTHLASLRALAAVYEEKGFRRKAAETIERALPAAPEALRATLREDVLRLLA